MIDEMTKKIERREVIEPMPFMWKLREFSGSVRKTSFYEQSAKDAKKSLCGEFIIEVNHY